ncbi:MAG: hypothetical protein WCC69_13045 [Pirellulales bacterium]
MPPIKTTSRFTGARGCVSDIATLALRVPLFPVDRVIQLAPLAEARAACSVRIGWAAIFLKAYALVAREMPVLRSWFSGGLFPRLVTVPHTVATLAVNRTDAAMGDRLLFARLCKPEAESLVEIQRFIHDCTTEPFDKMFKRQLQLEMVPGPLRRTILRWNMQSRSAKRASRIGTFSLSTLAGQGATNRFHPTLCTTSLSYAPLESDGRCMVTLIADHRVLDGAVVARALQWLEQALQTDIAAELIALRSAPPAAVAPQRAAA